MNPLGQHAVDVWRAGVAAVDSSRLVRDAVRVEEDALLVAGERIPRSAFDRIVVLGAGKAGAGMAAAIEEVVSAAGLGDALDGWVNVPADCVRPLRRISLHAARPAGVNEPTEAGVEGAARILDRAASLGPRDVCLVLLSGGGSALLPAPVEEITLADKQAVTRLLMSGGASIDELNTVRKQLSRIKGGGLARAAAAANRVVALIVSDVIGDPLDVIASGPTVPNPTTAADALRVLRERIADASAIPERVRRFLEERTASAASWPPPFPGNVANHVIGNNRVALEAASRRAAELGYEVVSRGSDNAGVAREVGAELAETCLAIRDRGEPAAAPVCVLSGGEPIVHLAETDRPRKGGRNQEVALAAILRLWDDGGERIAVLSGGTDGEDGPTDAAGGIAEAGVIAAAHAAGLDPVAHLAINDSYPFLERAGGLLVTGPTHTNVMDLRVALVGPA